MCKIREKYMGNDTFRIMFTSVGKRGSNVFVKEPTEVKYTVLFNYLFYLMCSHMSLNARQI